MTQPTIELVHELRNGICALWHRLAEMNGGVVNAGRIKDEENLVGLLLNHCNQIRAALTEKAGEPEPDMFWDAADPAQCERWQDIASDYSDGEIVEVQTAKSLKNMFVAWSEDENGEKHFMLSDTAELCEQNLSNVKAALSAAKDGAG